MQVFQRPTKTEAYDIIKRLIEKYEAQKSVYLSPNYNEARTRQDFIDGFFEALGWDIANQLGELDGSREVITEYKMKIGNATRSPDYFFQPYGIKEKSFFVEAKKPFINLKTDPEPARQLRNYAWNGKLHISITTNFAELAVYDCTQIVKNTDGAMTKRLAYLAYTDYLTKFDFLWGNFAYESVVKGSIEAFVKEKINLKLAEPVDEVFLTFLNKCREYLATNVAQRNKNLEEEEINFAVQLLIDRIVFLRVCEDRNVEPNEQLLRIAKAKGDIYQNLFEIFKKADQRYNSGIFDLKKESITQNLDIDNKVIKNILKDLYNEDNDGVGRFNFAIIPIEILGYAYEQFLGKVIVLQKTGKATIEEKPEVRKAGGVYYTPSYIVKYIVENTVGKAIEGKTPEEVSSLTVLDPSCGSGSFLIGAYQFLLDWHLRYYIQNPPKNKKYKKENPLSPDGKHLTSAEKKRILLNNIYGVDIDKQAVEVTKLSLLLKALENETEASINTSLQMFNERVLPTIDGNVQSGNSLIGLDFYEQDLGLNKKERQKINAFDWRNEYREIFVKGGFHCIIGNPPWGAEFKEIEKDYLVSKYKNIPSKTKDSFLFFISKMLRLLRKDGFLGLITPNTWLLINNTSEFRKDLLGYEMKAIADYGDGVFKDATVESCVFVLQNTKASNYDVQVLKYRAGELLFQNTINTSIWLKDEYNRIVIGLDDEKSALLDKIVSLADKFEKNCEIIWGIKPYQVGHGTPPQTQDMLEKRIYHSDYQVDSSWKPLLVGKNVNRYFVQISAKKPIQYIQYGECLMYPSNEKKMLAPKILLRQTSADIKAVYDENGYYCQNSVFIITSETIELKYLLALLNSRLIDFVYKLKNPQEKKVFAEIKPSVIKTLPIKKLDLNNKLNKKVQEKIVKLVDEIMQDYQDLAKCEENKDMNGAIDKQKQITYKEEVIDDEIYKLYNLTEDEIKIIYPNYLPLDAF